MRSSRSVVSEVNACRVEPSTWGHGLSNCLLKGQGQERAACFRSILVVLDCQGDSY